MEETELVTKTRWQAIEKLVSLTTRPCDDREVLLAMLNLQSEFYRILMNARTGRELHIALQTISRVLRETADDLDGKRSATP
jgi:hypothetical protein